MCIGRESRAPGVILFQAVAPLSSGQYLLVLQQCYPVAEQNDAPPMFLLACLHRVRLSVATKISRYNLARHSHQQKSRVASCVVPRSSDRKQIFLLLVFFLFFFFFFFFPQKKGKNSK